MRIQITEEDIQGAEQNEANNPIDRALERATGGRWCVFEGTTAWEVAAPNRQVILPEEVFNRWLLYETGGTMQPFEFELELPPSST